MMRLSGAAVATHSACCRSRSIPPAATPAGTLALCADQAIPDGYAIVGYSRTAACGGTKTLSSPPAGYVIVGQSKTAGCGSGLTVNTVTLKKI